MTSVKPYFLSLSLLILPIIVSAKTMELKQMELTSTAFSNNQIIPKKYTCDGDDISPSLAWKNAPENTKSFVLLVDDPDAPRGTWDHWILFNIPADINSLPENMTELPVGTKEAINSWGNTGYGGPCPPSGVHRYFFKLYALDVMLTINKKPTRAHIIDAMDGHIIEQVNLIGKYQR